MTKHRELLLRPQAAQVCCIKKRIRLPSGTDAFFLPVRSGCMRRVRRENADLRSSYYFRAAMVIARTVRGRPNRVIKPDAS